MAKTALKGNEVNTIGDLPAIGSSIGDYEFTKQDLGGLKLSDLKGKKVILNIFPSVDTSTCATSVRKFNQQAASLNNTTVVCVSKDLPFAIARFCGAEGIQNVEATSDFRTLEFARENGIEMIDGPLKGLDARSIIVLNEEGKVVHTELVPEIVDEPNYEAALKAL